jgi:Protein of unknown function (DUF3892)
MTEHLISVQRNHLGDIINFQTSSGRIISYRKAIQEVTQGTIDGVSIQEEQNGASTLTPSISSTFNEYPIF